MKIEEIDKNFQARTLGDQEFLFKNVTEAPFSLEGFAWRNETPDTPFHRMPDRMKEKVNEGAFWLARQASGGAVRFRTDSNIIALRAALVDSSDMNHMPRAGSAGFDLYMSSGAKMIHIGTAQPSRDQAVLELVIANTSLCGMHSFLLNFPLYGGTSSVEIGLLPGAVLEAPEPHKIEKPILFYGSSITQGGCASRPGNAYTSMLCRDLDAEQINLGFSGSGLGEPGMAELIAELDLAAFVMDYDHNTPSVEHLKATHEPFFRIIRDKHPELPVLMLSLCNIWPEVPNEKYKQACARRDVIRETWQNAVARGDKNVWFVDGETLFGKKNRCDCTVDRCHPNDLGFYRMYKHVLPVLKQALNLR